MRVLQVCVAGNNRLEDFFCVCLPQNLKRCGSVDGRLTHGEDKAGQVEPLTALAEQLWALNQTGTGVVAAYVRNAKLALFKKALA